MTQSVQTTLSELRRLRARIDARALDADDWPVIAVLVSQRIARAERQQAKMAAKAAQEAQTTASDDEAPGPIIDADYSVVGPEVEGDGEAVADTGAGADEAAVERGHKADEPTKTSASGKAKPKRPGHGRNGASAYVNAKHFFHKLAIGVIGALCDACGRGRILPYREKLIVRIEGQPIFCPEVHHFEQGRCKLCGAIIRADGDSAILDGVGSSYITYGWSACAMLIVMHYFAGLPFKRLEGLHAGWGIPMSDANQWSLANASHDLLFPLYKALEKHGIQHAFALRIDDTGAVIVSIRREIRAEIELLERLGASNSDVRTGINVTGVYLETKQGKVLLFFTGRHHASEIIDQLLQSRLAGQSKEKLVKVSDAASKNFSHAHGDKLDEAVCNAHAFLKFRAVKDQHPEEYSLAGEVYNKVFDNDDITESQGMSPDERMRYHRQHSLPEMQRLKKMCCDKLENKLVEPNSPLWEPITFIVNQWERLTKFCDVPGIPLDTNVVEQMLVIPVRFLASSFNYQTQNGADVGDRHMSLIATANANGVEPVTYLTECLRNHEDLAKRPEYYFPWAYRERLEAAEQAQTGERPKAGSTVHPLRPGTHRVHPSRSGPMGTDPPTAAELGDTAGDSPSMVP